MAIYNINGNALQTAYDITVNLLSYAYDVVGNLVFSGEIDYSNYSISNYCNVSLSPTQGFDIYNGTIFQFIANLTNTSDRMATINANTSSIINSNVSAVAGHGNSASFSSEFYSESDDFPLLYVSPDMSVISDTEPTLVYVNRVTTGSSQLVKTYKFPLDKTGYYAGLCLDEENQIMYMLGYSEYNYSTDDSGNNKTVISKWDMSSLTNNGDGTYTPTFISSYERPFIYTMQGLQYHDEMLWVASGGTGVRGYVYALNPSNGNLLYTIDTNTTTEIEGISFISATEMVFGLQGGEYKKVTFSTL